MLAKEASAGVLFDAEEAVEGEQGRAPISGVCKDGEVDVRSDGAQVAGGDATRGLAVVGVAVPVEQAGFDAGERAAAGYVGVAHAQRVVGDGGHEAGEAGDAVAPRVHDADAAELELAEWSVGVDADGSADGAERVEARVVRAVRVETQRVAGEAADERT